MNMQKIKHTSPETDIQAALSLFSNRTFTDHSLY